MKVDIANNSDVKTSLKTNMGNIRKEASLLVGRADEGRYSEARRDR